MAMRELTRWLLDAAAVVALALAGLDPRASFRRR